MSPDGLPVFIRLSAAAVSPGREAEIVRFLSSYRQLNHASLINIRDFWIEGGYLGLVTDLADGGSLKDRMRQRGAFAGRALVSLFRPLGEATDFLHRQGILHGDIRSTNLMLLRDVPRLDVPRLRDIGVGIVFTPSYTAPEVVQHAESQQSDQYSLAASYAELRLGRPIYSEILSDGLSKIRNCLERDPDLEPLPEGERDVLGKALAKNPAQRYPTCLALVEDLQRVVDRPGDGWPARK